MRALMLNGEWAPRPSANLSDEDRRRQWAPDARLAWRNPQWCVEDQADPTITEPDDIIVRVRAVGLANSNIRMGNIDDEGYVVLPYSLHLPLIPGHEIAGEVVETGSAVTTVRPGDPVCVEALRACLHCSSCLRGLFNQCLHTEFTGLTINGGMAQYLVTKARQVRPIGAMRARFDEQAMYEVATLAEPAAVAYNGMFVRAGGFQPGLTTVAVFGCGPIGLAAVALARCSGAIKIIAFDIDDHRCQLARKLGADEAYNSRTLLDAGGRPGQQVMELTHGKGADFIVEAAGDHHATAPEIEACLATWGKVVYLGVEGRGNPSHLLAYQRKAAATFAMMGHIGGYDPIIALHANGRMDLSPLIDRRYPMEQAVEAIARLRTRQDAKVLILPHE